MSDKTQDPLPVLAILHDAFAIPWRKRAIMFRALLPASLIIIAGKMIDADLVKKAIQFAGPFALVPLLAVGVLMVVAFIVFAVTCHRLVLLGEGSVPYHGLTTWTSRETRFFGWGLLGLVSYMVMLFLVAVVAVPVIAILLQFLKMPEIVIRILVLPILLPGIYVLARSSVLLPATAVDQRPSIKWAVDVTRGNGWRLVLVVGILPVALGLVLDLSLGHSVIADIVVRAVGCVLYAIDIAALSLSYRHLAGRRACRADKAA